MGGTRRSSESPRASRVTRAKQVPRRPQAGRTPSRDDAELQAGDILSVQRARLLSAAIGLLAEEGHEAFSAAAICARAGVSRRTFYEIFHGREACLLAVLEDAEKWATSTIRGLELGDAAWSERMRMGLWAILCLVEREPALARVCLIESQRAGTRVQAERARIVRRLVELVDEGRSQSGARASAATPLTAEALVGAVSGVIATRLTDARSKNVKTGEGVKAGAGVTGLTPARSKGAKAGASPDVCALLGELAGMIVLPYLGPAAARREHHRQLPEAPALGGQASGVHTVSPDLFAGLKMRLTYRTARVLAATAQLAKDGSGASNKQIGQHAGIADQGQISKLLRRLQTHGLIVNTADEMAGARGEANNWRLTGAGGRLAHGIATEALQARTTRGASQPRAARDALQVGTTHESAGKARGGRRG